MRISQIVARVGAVEGFVAQREVGDDVAFDRRLQQRPLEPGGIARVAAGDPPVRAEAHATRRRSPRNASTSATPSPRRDGRRRRRAIGPAAGGRASARSARGFARPRRCAPAARASTSPSIEHRHLEVEPVVGRIGEIAARVEGAARGAADEAAGGVGATSSGVTMPVVHGAVLQRRLVVVDPHDLGERVAELAEQGRGSGRRRRLDRSAATPPGTMRSIIRRWPKQRVGRRQHLLAQQGAMGVQQRERWRRCRSRRCRRCGWRCAPARP